MNSITRRAVAAAAGIALVTGAGVMTTAPAYAVTAHISLSKWEAYHYADSQVSIVRHFDVANGKYIYALWATRGGWSQQASCWAGVTNFGAQAG